MKRYQTLSENFEKYTKEIEELKRMKTVFVALYDQEKNSMVKRKSDLEDEITTFKDKERKLQRRYKMYKEKLFMLEKSNKENGQNKAQVKIEVKM
jgi:chaperonin cofactor prefoldin